MIFQIDMRPYLPSVRDQGPRGTCLAFAVTGAHEYVWDDSNNGLLDLSEEALYWRAHQLCGPTAGISFGATAIALKNQGQPEEASWPYDPFRDENDGSYFPPANALHDSSCFNGNMESIIPSLDAIKMALNSHSIVVIGIRISTPLYDELNGIILMPTPNELLADGHAIAIVGYADPEDIGDYGYLIFRNSWGEDWGDNGYGYLPYDYYLQYGSGAYVVSRDQLPT